MYKNLKRLAVECLENGNYHVYRKIFAGITTFLKWITAPKNLQKLGNKHNKILKNSQHCQIMYTSNQ